MLPIPLQEKISVKKAVFLGFLFINVPVLLLIFGPITVSLLLAIRDLLPAWIPLVSFPFGIGLAWCWWSITTPKWRLWALRRVDNLYKLHQQAMKAQLVWPHGSIYENTEFKSPLHVLQEKHVAIHNYFDKFRYYLDYLETTGKPFYGIHETRQGVDAFRDSLYYSNKNSRYNSALKVSIDQLRYLLKSIRLVRGDAKWAELIDALVVILNDYQLSSKHVVLQQNFE